MGGRSEIVLEFNSMVSLDDKWVEYKGKKLICKIKMEVNELFVLIYIFDENVYYEFGGRWKYIFRDKSCFYVKMLFEFKLIWLFVLLE